MLRTPVTKLLQTIQEETGRTDVNSDCLLELLATLSQKDKGLQEIEPDIEQEIPLDELNADMVRTMDYQDNTNLWRMRAERAIERAGVQWQELYHGDTATIVCSHWYEQITTGE